MFTDATVGGEKKTEQKLQQRSNAIYMPITTESPLVGSLPSSQGVVEDKSLRTTETISPNEMQLVYDWKQNQYLSIHDLENNIVAQEYEGTYIDKNFDQGA